MRRCAEALKSTECVKSMLADYTRRRDILVDGINAIPGFTCAKPKGSFYAFVNIKAFGKSSQEFAEELIRGAHVICVPGTAFGAMRILLEYPPPTLLIVQCKRTVYALLHVGVRLADVLVAASVRALPPDRRRCSITPPGVESIPSSCRR